MLTPRYDFLCKENDQIVEVIHPLSIKLTRWGEVCEKSGLELGAVSADSPVERITTTAPMANTRIDNSGLKNLGFTKLVKRDDGVYENVTRTGTKSKFMEAGDPSSMPHLNKKISD